MPPNIAQKRSITLPFFLWHYSRARPCKHWRLEFEGVLIVFSCKTSPLTGEDVVAQKGLRRSPNVTELMAGPWPEVASFSEKPSKKWALLVYTKLCYPSTLPVVNSWKILNVEGGKSVLLFRASLNASVSRARINTFPSGRRSYRPQPRIVSGLEEYFKTSSLSAPGNLT